MEQLKLKDLKASVDAMVAKGYGEKYLVVASDNEGNEYHGMFFGISPATDDIDGMVYDSVISDTSKLLIVG